MTRKEVLTEQFLNISLDPQYLDLYYVRNSILKAIESNIPNFKGSLLDVGCGIMPYRELIVKNGNVTSYTGLDFEDSLDPEYALGKPDLFWKGDIIPLNDNSVDTIIATEFFEHCPDPEKVMREMLRVLKPDGILFFTVPFLWNLHLVPYDEYRYTPFSLKRHLTNAGFKDIVMESLGGWDASLAQMLGIWYKQRPLSKKYKKMIAFFIIPVMKRLIKMDLNFDKSNMFQGGSMITGICGTAY